MHIGEKAIESKHNLLTTIAYSPKREVNYALEGSVFIGGACIQLLRDELRFFSDSSDSEYLTSKISDSKGVYVVPAFTGLGAPYWYPYARGVIFGITREINRNHITRASLEAISYQTPDILEAMQNDSGISLE